MKFLKDKQTRHDFVTYAMCIVAFAIVFFMQSNHMIPRMIAGQLVPITAYIVMAISLNLVVGIAGDLSSPISAYSHGMKQKLAIISAWLHEPKLILMDEPFVGLDPKAAHILKGMMREHCDAGGAIFFSTHVLEVAEKLCDKVAIIKQGRLIASGTMDEVKGDQSLEDVFLELEGEGNV
mgnify:CR=1 FL=1